MHQHTRPTLHLDMVQLSLEDEHFSHSSTTTTPRSPKAWIFSPTDTLVLTAPSRRVLIAAGEVPKANGFTPLYAEEETRDYEPFADRPSAYDNWRKWVEVNVPQQDQWANEALFKPGQKPKPPALHLKQGKLVYKKLAKASTDILQKPSTAKLASGPAVWDWSFDPPTLPSTTFSPVLDPAARRPKLKVRTSFSLPTLPATVYQPPPVAAKKRPAPLELFSVQPTESPSKKQRASAEPMPLSKPRKATVVGPGKWSALKMKRELEQKRSAPKKGGKGYSYARRGAVDMSFGDK